MSTPLLIVKTAKIKNILLLLASVGLVALGVLVLVKGKPSAAWVGWASILFFGLGIPIFAKEIFDARPRVVLSDAGVFDRTLGVGVIPWAEIREAYLMSIHGNPFICLVLDNPREWVRRLSATQRALAGANEKLGFQPLNVNLSGTAVDPELVLDVVLKKSSEARLLRDGVSFRSN